MQFSLFSSQKDSDTPQFNERREYNSNSRISEENRSNLKEQIQETNANSAFSTSNISIKSADPTVTPAYTEDYIKQIYLYMYPEDKAMTDVYEDRATIIAEFLVKIEAKKPTIIDSYIRYTLQRREISPAEVDKMTPLQANALSYRLIHDTLNLYSHKSISV